MEQRSLETNKRLLNNQKLQKKELGKILDEKVKGVQADKKAADQAARDARKRMGDRVGAAVSAGAFPLLFGGGPGMALGGAIGGAATGQTFGPAAIGLQVLGGALDQFVAKTAELGQSLSNVGGDFDLVADAAGLARTASKNYLSEIKQLGADKEALRLATQSLADVVGIEGVNALREFGDESQNLSSAFSQAMAQMQASLSKLLGPLIGPVSGAIQEAVDVGAAQTSTDPRLVAIQKELTERRKGLGRDPSLPKRDSVENRQAIRDLVEEQRKILAQIKRDQADTIRLTAERLKREQGIANLNLQTPEQLKLQQALLQTNLDLTDKNVQSLQEQLITENLRVREREILNDIAKKDLDGATAGRLLEEARLDADKKRQTLRLSISSAEEAAYRKQQIANRKQLTASSTIEQQLKKQLSRYEEIDPIARNRAIIDADHLAIMERISTVQDDIKRKDLEALANSVRTARQNALNQQIQDEATEKAEKQTKLFENKLTAAENEGRLLQAQLDGRLEEEQLLINIEQLTKGMSAPRAAQLETQLRQNEGLKKQVELSEKLDKVYEQIESTLATGLSSALQSVINKTESLGDAVKGVLADIGNMLLRMGIETAIKAGFSAITSGGPSVSTPLAIGSPSSFGGGNLFAEGGYVSGPTRAIVGEGGESEYIIPESKMRESMSRYSRGARGSSVIPESGESGTVGGDGGGTAIAAPIDVRYTVERINDVEYVTAAQFQAGMRQAAAQGAQRGEQQTLRRLQMSGSTRRRIGL